MDIQVVNQSTKVVSQPVILGMSRQARRRMAGALVLSILGYSLILATSAHAQTGGDVAGSVKTFLDSIMTIIKTATPVIATIAFIGLGVMYMGSAIPMIADWKKDNPKAANQVVMGLIFVLLASGAGSLLSGAIIAPAP